MIRSFVVVCLALLAAALPARAQEPQPHQEQPRSVSGTWRVDFVTPLGQNWIIMTINQSGAKLTGHATDEFGEYEISGRVAGDQVTVVWSVAEDGKMLEITMKGKLESPTLITGTAKLGDVGEGPLSARRTGDAGDY
jgi:Zn-dependent alcohol dehydrogenase